MFRYSFYFEADQVVTFEVDETELDGLMTEKEYEEFVSGEDES